MHDILCRTVPSGLCCMNVYLLEMALQTVFKSLTLVLREFPCKLFHTTGKCVNNDECMFSHEPLNDDTQELLSKVRPTVITSSHLSLLNVIYLWIYMQNILLYLAPQNFLYCVLETVFISS